MLNKLPSDVCALLYNPFGPRAFDIDHDENSTGVRKLGMALATGVTIPSSFNSTSKIDFTQGGAAASNMNDTIRRKRDHFTNGHRLLFADFLNRRASEHGSTIGTRSGEVPSGMAKVVEDSSSSSSSDSEDSSARRRRIRREKKAAKEGRRRKSQDSNQDDFHDQPRDHLHRIGDRKKKNGRKPEPSDFAMSV